MTLGLYSIRDVRSGFGVPSFEVNDGVAVRNFRHAVQSSFDVLKSHKSDFSLYCVGFFDTDTGLLQSFASSELRLLIDGAAVEVSD